MSAREVKEIKVKDIEAILRVAIGSDLKKRIEGFKLEYGYLQPKERDEAVLKILNVLSKEIIVSGEHRIKEWDNGWNENFENFKKTKDINYLIPKYHGKYNLVRWLGDIVKGETENFDYKIHICFVDAILQHYLKDCENIIEFGCGPAYHLIRYNQFNDKVNLTGCDWANSSQNIIKEINENLNLGITPHNFDFFKPDYNLHVREKTGIYTVAALEQVGENYKAFVDWILKKKPSIVVNIEPIDELLDENKLIDYLSIRYFRKRNYLSKYLPYLEQLEEEGKIEIIRKQRTWTGSFYIEGHSLIVWRVK